MKLLLLVIVACAGLAIVESGSLRVKPSRQGVESELKALEHVDKVLEKEIDVVNKMESNRNKDDNELMNEGYIDIQPGSGVEFLGCKRRRV